ncbi:putative integral membrane protein [Cryptosporidium felis]|nr:putative integral membrane protein [Cryptosporidium felis]
MLELCGFMGTKLLRLGFQLFVRKVAIWAFVTVFRKLQSGVYSIEILERDETYCNENNLSDLICVPKKSIMEIIEDKISENKKGGNTLDEIDAHEIFNQLDFVKNPIYSCGNPKSKLIELDSRNKTFMCVYVKEMQKVLQCKAGYTLTEVLVENPSKMLGYGESEIRVRSSREKKYAIKSDKLCIKVVRVPVSISCDVGKLKNGFCVEEITTNPLYECPTGLHLTPKKWCGYIKKEMNESLMENVIRRTNPGCVVKKSASTHSLMKHSPIVECYGSQSYVLGITGDDWVNVIAPTIKCPKGFEIIYPKYPTEEILKGEFTFPPICLSVRYFPRNLVCPGTLIRNGLIVKDRYIVEKEINPTPFKQFVDVSHYSCQIQDRLRPSITCPINGYPFSKNFLENGSFMELSYQDSNSIRLEKILEFQSGLMDYLDFLKEEKGLEEQQRDKEPYEQELPKKQRYREQEAKKGPDEPEELRERQKYQEQETQKEQEEPGKPEELQKERRENGISRQEGESVSPLEDGSAFLNNSSLSPPPPAPKPPDLLSNSYFYNNKLYSNQFHTFNYYFNDTMEKHLKSTNEEDSYDVDYSYYPFRLNTTLDNPWKGDANNLRRGEVSRGENSKHLKAQKTILKTDGEYFNDYQWGFLSRFFKVYLSNQYKFVSNIPISPVSHKALTVDGGGYLLNVNLDPTYQSFLNYTWNKVNSRNTSDLFKNVFNNTSENRNGFQSIEDDLLANIGKNDSVDNDNSLIVTNDNITNNVTTNITNKSSRDNSNTFNDSFSYRSENDSNQNASSSLTLDTSDPSNNSTSFTSEPIVTTIDSPVLTGINDDGGSEVKSESVMADSTTKESVLNSFNFTTSETEYDKWERSARIYFMSLDLMKKNQILYSSINHYSHRKRFPYLYYYSGQPKNMNNFGHTRRPAVSDHKYRYGSPSEDYHKYTGRYEKSDFFYHIHKYLNQTKPYRHSPGPENLHNCISIDETTPIIECPKSYITIPRCFILDMIYYKQQTTQQNHTFVGSESINSSNQDTTESDEAEKRGDSDSVPIPKKQSQEEEMDEAGDLEVIGSLQGSGDIIDELGYLGNLGELQDMQMLGNLQGVGGLWV